MDDPRTTAQLSADTLVQLIRIAVDADPGTILGARRSSVRVMIADSALRSGTGTGVIEGNPVPVSLRRVQQIICDTGIVGITFEDDGQSLNVGREHRLFTPKQRIALAARDGGCLITDCDRPPSWTEAHHIDEWKADQGRTDVADGVLLCFDHHMLLHNNGWRIVRDGAVYFLVPPPDVDPAQTPIRLESKNRLLKQVTRRAG